MKHYLHAVIAGLVVLASTSLSHAQHMSRLDRDAASSTLLTRRASNLEQSGATAAAGCPDGEIPDCNGNCAPLTWVGDSVCDNGVFPYGGILIFFNCDAYDCDGGDCATELCTSSDCGNSIIEPGEECDDGNSNDADFCLSDCRNNPAIPTVSEWGLAAMTLLTLAAGTVLVRQRTGLRYAAPCAL